MSSGNFSLRRPRVPWGDKKKITETNPPKVSATLCSQSHWHTDASRNWRVLLRSFQKQRFLRILRKRNSSYSTKWDNRFPSCNLSDVQKLSEFTERRSNKSRLHHCHRERGSNLVAICSWCCASSFSARGHWSRTEDYPSMRGSSNSACEGCKTIDEKVSIRRHRLLNKRSKSFKVGSAISWSSSWTT